MSDNLSPEERAYQKKIEEAEVLNEEQIMYVSGVLSFADISDAKRIANDFVALATEAHGAPIAFEEAVTDEVKSRVERKVAEEKVAAQVGADLHRGLQEGLKAHIQGVVSGSVDDDYWGEQRAMGYETIFPYNPKADPEVTKQELRKSVQDDEVAKDIQKKARQPRTTTVKPHLTNQAFRENEGLRKLREDLDKSVPANKKQNHKRSTK